jgi:competence protein ComEC
LGLLLGTALQLQQVTLAPVWLSVLGLLLALGLAAAGFVLNRVGRAAWVGSLCSLLAGLLLGLALTGWRASSFEQQALEPTLEGRDVVVTGRVLAMPQQSEDALRFRFGVEQAWVAGEPVRLPPQIYLGWYAGYMGEPARPTKAAARPQGAANDPLTPEDEADRAEALQQAQRLPQSLRAGDRWRMTVRLKAPHGNSNPHGFDYELWLWEQGLQATGSVRNGVRDAPPSRLGEAGFFPVERARQAVRAAIFERVPDRQLAGVLAALVMGDQNAIERADWDVFRATGVAHLMSISGLHITLFAWLSGRLLGWLWRRSARWSPRGCLALPASSAAAWGGLLLAAAYALFSGWGVPAQRTVWMLAVVVVLRQSGRQWAWPHVWLLAMAAVLLLDPWALLQAGFWLSFVAVGVLFAVDPGSSQADRARQQEAFDAPQWGAAGLGARRAFIGAMLVQAAVAAGRMAREQWVITLALAPLSLLLFNQVSLVGLLANAVAIPWVTLLVTPLALLGVLFNPLWDLAASLTGWLGAGLQVLAQWSWATFDKASAPLWCAVAGTCGALLLAMRLPWHWRALGVPLLLPVLMWQGARPAEGQFELLAADVGQGNAVLVRTARHSLLYDAGPRFSRESDAGHRVLVPLLRAYGERLDTLLLSHRDTDHVGGAAAVLAMQKQAALMGSLDDDHGLRRSQDLQGRPSGRCVAGQRWTWDGVDFEVLHPAAGDYDLALKPNAMSCVLRIASAPQSAQSGTTQPGAQAAPGPGRSAVALLVGDIELAQEQALLAEAGTLKADFLLMPHHGSKTSSSPAFLEAVGPQLALAQAGYRNRFGHPVPVVLERYRARGIAVVASPACGAATWRSEQPGALRCHRQEALRYWHHRPPELAAQVLEGPR